MTALATRRFAPVFTDERTWRRTVLVVIVLALIVRAGLVGVTGGGNDLKIYNQFSHLAIHGVNPYTDQLPPGLPEPARLGDNLPGELLLFGGLLKIHDSADSLRVLFMLADAGVIALIGFAYPRPRQWRAAFIGFYAFNPLVLGSWTATAEDKTVLFLLFAVVLLGLERAREGLSWAGTALLGAIKGISFVFMPPLALHTLRARGWRTAAWMVAATVVVLALAHLPWFPDSLRSYSRRSDHIATWVPGHASLMQIPSRLGFYDPAIVRIGSPLLLLAVYVGYLLRRIDIRETIVLASLATVVLLPDQSYPRCLFAALPFLLIIRLDTRRWALIWVVSTIASIFIWFQYQRGAARRLRDDPAHDREQRLPRAGLRAVGERPASRPARSGRRSGP